MINNANDLICIFMNFNENTKTIEKTHIKTISELISYLNYHCDKIVDVMYENYIICIFMNINDNDKNQETR